MGQSTLTGLIPTLYNAVDVVSRELVGIIPAVSSDMTFERAAVGQTVTSPVAPASTASDISPAVIPPDDGDQTIGNISMTIQKARRVPVRWNGEQSRALNSPGGPGRNAILVNQFAQAMRTLANECEADGAALYAAASRAYGTAGTTPFATAGDFQDATNVLKILKDNGAPTSDLQLIIDTTAGAKMLGTQARYDVAGDQAVTMQQQGVLLRKAGFELRESAKIATPAAGTGASYTTNTAGYAVGATAITLITGTGTVLAGDVVTFAGDPRKYVVAGALSGGVITLAAPGLMQAIPASATAVTVVSAATRNMAFARTAMMLATRAPAVPEEGDSAVDSHIITDPRSGLSFEVRQYMQYRQVQFEIGLAWGWKCVKPEHLALLLG